MCGGCKEFREFNEFGEFNEFSEFGEFNAVTVSSPQGALSHRRYNRLRLNISAKMIARLISPNHNPIMPFYFCIFAWNGFVKD